MDRGAWGHKESDTTERLNNKTSEAETRPAEKRAVCGVLDQNSLTVLCLSKYVGPSSFLSALCGSLCSALGWAEKRTGLPETVLQETQCYIRQPSSPNYSLT